jgi:hypothetical protein
MVGRSNERSPASKLAGLSGLDLQQLRARWLSLYGREPSARLSRQLLIGAIAYKLQENSQGGLSAAARKFLADTAAGKKPAAPTPQFKPGTVLLREWQGVTHEVTMLDRGVLYRGEKHSSLTKVARLISGIHRSGPAFFGMRDHAQQ